MRRGRNGIAYEMTRIIYPVGLGAFCIERLCKADDGSVAFDMMYDCGSISSGMGAHIQNEVQNLYGNKPIDLVCISHFDTDHINEFKNLLGTPFIQPNRTTILMPQILGDSILEKVGDDVYINFSALRGILANNGYKVVYVRPMGNDAERIEDYTIDVEELGGRGQISSGARLTLSQYDRIWEYIPFNNFDETYNGKLLSALKIATGFNDQQLETIRKGNANQNDVDTLKKAYEQLGKTQKGVSFINCNSLQILSKAADGIHSGGFIFYQPIWNINKPCYPCYLYFPVCPCIALNSSCMYTGDSVMDPKMETVRQRYLGDERLGLFQIPHHGSEHCYKQDVIDQLYFQAAFVNTDFSNKKLSIAKEVPDWINHNIPAMFMALKGNGIICEYIY